MIIASAGMSMTYIHGTRILGNGDGHVPFPIGPPWNLVPTNVLGGLL